MDNKTITDGIKVRGHVTAIARNSLGEITDYREFHERAKPYGRVELWAIDPNGVVTDYRKIDNLIVDDGYAGIAGRFNGHGSPAAFATLALGTGTTAAAAGDSTLETEITDSGLGRGAATTGLETDAITDDTATLDKSWSVTGSKAVTELGVLNNPTAAGDLASRVVFGAMNVANGYTFRMVYKVTFS